MLRIVRRVALAFSVLGCVAAALRGRGAGGSSSAGGAWRELSGPDLR